ncbi:MAG TPA: hypothetical protein VGI37_00860 [Streptosporangiaceae bacterium]
MTEHIASRLRRLASPRRARAASPGARAAALVLRLGCTALLAWIGYVHLHLWLEGYRHIPTNGPLFLLDAVAGFILAAVVLVRPRPLAGLLAAGYTAATLGALLISLAVGLFGFRESISASYVVESIIIEAITVLALITWTVLVTATPQAARRPAVGRPADGPQPRPPMRSRSGGVGDLSRVRPQSEPPADRFQHPASRQKR